MVACLTGDIDCYYLVVIEDITTDICGDLQEVDFPVLGSFPSVIKIGSIICVFNGITSLLTGIYLICVLLLRCKFVLLFIAMTTSSLSLLFSVISDKVTERSSSNRC